MSISPLLTASGLLMAYMGSLAPWGPQDNWTASSGGSKQAVVPGSGDVIAFSDLASEVMQCHFLHILLVTGKSQWVQGEGN